MLLYLKLDDETQMGSVCDHAATDISSKFSIFLPLRAILKNPYHYETPCISRHQQTHFAHWNVKRAYLVILGP